jgi:hypothetical protein
MLDSGSINRDGFARTIRMLDAATGGTTGYSTIESRELRAGGVSWELRIEFMAKVFASAATPHHSLED